MYLQICESNSIFKFRFTSYTRKQKCFNFILHFTKCSKVKLVGFENIFTSDSREFLTVETFTRSTLEC